MISKIFAVIGLFFLALIAVLTLNNRNLVAPVDDSNNQPIIQQPAATAEDISGLVGATNQFGLDLLKQISASSTDNVFISPYSLSSAFGMVIEGAKGQTYLAMRDVLHLGDDVESRRSAFAEINKRVNTANKAYTLRSKNALWVNKDAKFLDSFTGTVRSIYSGEAKPLDFVGAPEQSRITINNWVANETENKIKDLLPNNFIDRYTRLILTNAVYFKGKWENKFDKSITTKSNFHLSSSQSEKVDLMQGDVEDLRYTDDTNMEMAELPYAGKDISMFVMLPKKGVSELSKVLTAEYLKTAIMNLKTDRVRVFLPKFRLEKNYSLSDHLVTLGMGVAFSDSADFSGMTGEKGLKISKVVHKTFVEVDEEGTEAAAATGIGMSVTSAPMPREWKEFRVDRPFIFIINDNRTGAVLFIGKINNPNK